MYEGRIESGVDSIGSMKSETKLQSALDNMIQARILARQSITVEEQTKNDDVIDKKTCIPCNTYVVST